MAGGGVAKPPGAMTVAQASGCMVAAIFLSRALGLVRDGVISYRFGLEADRDAYVAAFAIPDLLFFLIAGGALSSAFIPVFTRYWTKGSEDEAWRLFSVLVTFMGIVVLAFVVIAEIAARPLIEILRPGLPPEVMHKAASLSRILLPSQFGFFLGGLMFGTMNARRHFLIPALAPNIYNIGIILGAALLAPIAGFGIYGLAWGALGGALIGSLILPAFAMHRFGARFRPSLDLKNEGVRRVFKLMVPVVFGLSLPGVYALVVGIFGSYFERGTLSSLEIGNKIMQAPLGIFGQALAIAVFPTLATLFAQNDAPRFLSALSKSLRAALFIGLFVSALMFLMSEDIVRVFNQYGHFDQSDTAYVSVALKMFSIGVFAWCVHPVLMRAFFAMEDTFTPVLLGTLTTGVFVLLCSVLPHLNVDYAALLPGAPAADYRHAGLALAVSLSAIILMTLLLLGLRRKLGRVDGSRITRLFILGGSSAVLSAGLVYAVGSLIPNPPGLAANAASALRVLVLGLAGAWLYLGIGRMLGLEEARYALAAVTRRKPSPEDIEPPNPD